jgi:uncharacterized protein (DUF1697 family)
MTTYIAMLRGINVSGQKKVLMSDLKNLFDELGYAHAATYIQSGNVVFDAGGSESEVVQTLEAAIRHRFGFDVPVMVRCAADMNAIVQNYPFKDASEEHLYVAFLDQAPAPERVQALSPDGFLPDRWILQGREIYLHIPVSYGNTKLSNNFFENKLKVKATTRNWKTVQVLRQMAQRG